MAHADCISWLDNPSVGSRFSGAIKGIGVNTAVVMHSLQHIGIPEDLLLVGETATIYFVPVVLKDDRPSLLPDRHTRLVPHAVQDNTGRYLKEACAGIGCIGIGALPFGTRVLAQLDKNHHCCEVLRANHSPVVLEMDITDWKATHALHEVHPELPAFLAAGFPCQPFSTQGDGRAMSDSRSLAFLGILRSAYCMQARGLILECVPGAKLCTGVQTALLQLASAMGFQIKDVVLHLHHQWPSRRSRWWVVLAPLRLDLSLLVPWPIDEEFQQVRSAIPEWPTWTRDVETSLVPSEFALQCFQDPDFGSDQRQLVLTGLCPTLLHSYGCAFSACPCGCRTGPFTLHRLRTGGLRGILVLSQALDQLRYLHPKEMALLLAIPAQLCLCDDPFLSLCLLGQVASPLQALWVVGHLLQAFAVDEAPGRSALPSPEHALRDFKQHLLFDRHHLWPLQASHDDALISIQHEGTPIPTSRTGLLQLADLLQAEHKWRPWGTIPRVIDGQHVLSQEAILHAQGRHGPYNLVLQTKKASLPQPTSSLCIQILTEHGPFVHCVPAGTFLFQLLWDFPQWHYGIPIYSLDGSKQPADQRLWTSGIFLLYDPTGLGLPTTTTHPSTTHQPGLAASHIWPVSLLLQDYSPRSPLIINPWTAHAVLHNAGIIAIPTRPPRECLIPLAAQGHWCLIHLRLEENQLEALCYDGLFSVPLSEAIQLVSWLARYWQLPTPLVTMRRHFQQFESTTCGCVMLAHLATALGLDGSGFTEDPVGLTTLLQASFHGFGPFGCGPFTNPARQSLSALLVDKGVPDDKVEERIDLALRHLPPAEITQALAGKNPWAHLEAIASKVAFMWIKHDELEAKIRTSAQSQFKIQPSNRKARPDKTGRNMPALVLPDPQQLALVPDTFKCSDGSIATMLPFRQVGPDQQGIAFCTVQEALPFLQQDKAIATKPLALLSTTPVPTDARGNLPIVDLRFPAHHCTTKESVLVSGSLIQLGTGQITRHLNASLQVEHTPTQSVRIVVYKDALPGDWQA